MKRRRIEFGVLMALFVSACVALALVLPQSWWNLAILAGLCAAVIATVSFKNRQRGAPN